MIQVTLDIRKQLLMLICVALIGCFHTSSTSHAQDKIALIIGNGEYENFRTLRKPAADARLIGRALRELGFSVETVIDGEKRVMEEAVADFGKRLASAGSDAVGLFYYAGHGIQSQGRNYLVAVDSEAETENEIWRELSVGDVTRQIEFTGNRLNFIILAGC